MSPTSTFPLALNLSSVAEELEDLEVLRYLSISALSALVWDTILLLRYECRAIWKNAPIILRIGYAINKYGAILNLISLLIGITPLGVISQTGCLTIFYIGAILPSISETTGNALTVFKVVMSWNANRKILVQLSAGCIVVFVVNLICIGLGLRRESDNVIWIDVSNIRTCVIYQGIQRGYVIVMRVSQVLFDVFAVCLTILNGLKIPRKLDESFMKIIYEEKLVMLLVAFLLRVVYLVLLASSTNPIRLVIGTEFISALISIANSRLILELGRQYSVRDASFHLHILPRKR